MASNNDKISSSFNAMVLVGAKFRQTEQKSPFRVYLNVFLCLRPYAPTWGQVKMKERCYKSATLRLIRQLSHDGIGCETRVKFVISHWLVRVSFDPSVLLDK